MIPYEVSIKYMIGGYAVILTVLAVYLVSLITRWKNLKRDLKTLQDTDKK
jgi:hypothetical protein